MINAFTQCSLQSIVSLRCVMCAMFLHLSDGPSDPNDDKGSVPLAQYVGSFGVSCLSKPSLSNMESQLVAVQDADRGNHEKH